MTDVQKLFFNDVLKENRYGKKIRVDIIFEIFSFEKLVFEQQNYKTC